MLSRGVGRCTFISFENEECVFYFATGSTGAFVTAKDPVVLIGSSTTAINIKGDVCRGCPLMGYKRVELLRHRGIDVSVNQRTDCPGVAGGWVGAF